MDPLCTVADQNTANGKGAVKRVPEGGAVMEGRITSDMVNRRILLTGGSGFLGKVLVRDLCDSGHTVVMLGRQPAPVVQGVAVANANLADPGSLRAALEKLKDQPRFDAIVHLAASRHHREFPNKALDLFYVNTATAVELLDFARITGASRAVFGSTGAVYGEKLVAHAHVQGNDESEFIKPSTYFTASKLFADVFCDLYRCYLPIATLRFYVPYGPGLEDRMLTDLFARVRNGRPLSLPTSGPGFTFSAIYIDDAVAVIRRALAGSWNETVNVASPEAWTIESVGNLIGELVGREPEFERTAQTSAPSMIPAIRRLSELMPGFNFTGLRVGLQAMIASAGP